MGRLERCCTELEGPRDPEGPPPLEELPDALWRVELDESLTLEGRLGLDEPLWLAVVPELGRPPELAAPLVLVEPLELAL